MSDRGDTKLMNPEWVSRMKCGPFISKGKKIVLYISITTTEHIEIDGIAEEESSTRAGSAWVLVRACPRLAG